MTKDNIERLTSLIDANTERAVKSLLESIGVLIKKRGTVASVDEEKNMASVYFDGGSTESCMYANHTGDTLSVGDVCYVFCQYNKDTQGWIIVKG